MCGICGIVDWDGGSVEPRRLEAMRDVMRPRGPDDAGLHIEPGAALGFRRLAIIDLTQAGHQPMSNEDDQVWLVFNGEIYNFQSLRAELVEAGHSFRSRADSEVLIHGYEEWGILELARRLRGMFGFAIWDRPRRRLHLGRDHLGKKPVFWTRRGRRILFASDLKAIWTAVDGDLELDPEALDEFLYYDFITQDRTIFRGVHKLPPAHVATFEDDSVTLERYWSPDYTRREQRSEEEWLEGIDLQLRSAVERRLVSDVPIGAFLSGGVDSSVVCAVMAGLAPSAPRTFSVGFERYLEYDEREYASQVARHIGSEHTELILEPDVSGVLSDVVWQYGEPFGDSSSVPSYLVARAAREHVTVVLTGDGGDEAFAGYGRYVAADRANRLGPLRALGRLGLGASQLYARLWPDRSTVVRAELFASYAAGDPMSPARGICWWDGIRDQLYTEAQRRALGSFRPFEAQRPLLESMPTDDPVDRMLEWILRVQLPGDYLTKVDVATMAHSLEARSPFLDVDLLEFAMRIPPRDLVRDGEAKHLLKRHAESLIPRDVIYRPKQGFELPVARWCQTEWRDPLRRLLVEGPAAERGHFDPAVVGRILDEHASGRVDHSARIWTLLIFEVWNRLFVDRTLRPGDPVFES
jgi:asparagine synthase (glutamine-hydrolysing)